MSSKHPLFSVVKTALLLHFPFFASILLDVLDVEVGKFPRIFPQGNETMATDGRKIWIDEDFLQSLLVEHGVFGTCHEIAHAMWEHMSRGKQYQEQGTLFGQPFSPVLYNIAGDYVINDLLVKCKVGSILRDENGVPKWLLSDKYTCDWTVEAVYEDLLKNGLPPQQGQGSGQGDGQGKGGQFDTHVFDTGNAISPAEMRRAIQTAVDTARACGKLPGALERFAENLLAPQVSWKDILRTTVTNLASRDTTSWARPHRRRLAGQGVYLARPSAFGCNQIIWIWDSSGSIGQTELNLFSSECADIIRTCNPEHVILLGADSQVASVEEFTGEQDIDWPNVKIGGGGGTDFRPAFEWIREHGHQPDAVIYFTDMQGPFPSDDPGYPVIWCSTTEGCEGPFGKTIYVNTSKA